MNQQHILDEIKRTAVANGGVPLGRERFYQETGIKEADWSGKHWARWSDAVRDAGFTPNSLNARLDDSIVLRSYIALVRELGRFPVVSELKLKSKQDSAFPCHNTFRRLGNKQEVAQQILTHCNGKDEWAAVVQIAIAVLGSVSPGAGVSSAEQDEKIGFIYMLKAGRYYKVGRSNSFERRSRELAIQLPERAETVHVIRTDDPIGIELYWHRRFESKRKNGEWFELTAQDIGAFKRRKFM